MGAWSAACFTRVGGAEVVVACVVDPWWRRRRRRCCASRWLAGWLVGCWLAEAPATKGNAARSSKQAARGERQRHTHTHAHTEEQPAVVVDRPTQYKTTYLMMSEAHRAAAWFVVQCCYYCC